MCFLTELRANGPQIATIPSLNKCSMYLHVSNEKILMDHDKNYCLAISPHDTHSDGL